MATTIAASLLLVSGQSYIFPALPSLSTRPVLKLIDITGFPAYSSSTLCSALVLPSVANKIDSARELFNIIFTLLGFKMLKIISDDGRDQIEVESGCVCSFFSVGARRVYNVYRVYYMDNVSVKVSVVHFGEFRNENRKKRNFYMYIQIEMTV